MTEEELRNGAGALPRHAVREALLELLAEAGTLTSTGAAARLGYSSGLCSFHLRQLARYGLIEEVPHTGGRARPWRLRQAEPAAGPGPEEASPVEGFGALARGLEDESYARWLAQRTAAPEPWRGTDEAFSAVVYLTPEELGGVAAAVRQVLDGYRAREQRPEARPDGSLPVALIARLFPLLPGEADSSGSEQGR
ncbi:helix-turn-helix domain-containing protein [Streptacidiphilus carbonis]|uniref:helix-turn-helix domain-containing protein n=1 Tax=Streptacidiphilus carbonis TaxID=105422 RepID=UPI0005A708ED|nr:helix-turn-helix domain-containing protein [Streptacidiphilus carbonis]